MNVSAYSGAALSRGTRHFVVGKTLSAATSVVILLLLVRVLPVNEYAAYVTFVAAVEMAFALSFVGLPWLAARYLPEFRIHAPEEPLRKLCRRLVGAHFVIVLAFSLLLAVLLDAYLVRFGLVGYRNAAEIYLLVFVVEAIGRFAREGVLGALLLQGVIQISLVLRGLVFLLLLAIAAAGQELRLEQAAWAELFASLAASAFALTGLWRRLATMNPQPSSSQGWVEPTMRRMWPAALKMYASQLLTLVYSPQLVVNLIQLWLGAGAAATFGFLRNLYDLVGRYLPSTLLFNLVRPKLVASYVHAGDTSALVRHANLAGKVSLLALMPAVAFVAAGGDPMINWLSAGKIADTGLLFFGLLLALVPFSQRQLLETVAVATGRAGICIWAAASGLVVPLLMHWMLNLGMGLWAGIIGIGLGHLLFDAIVLYGVIRNTGFHADSKGFAKVAATGLAGYLAAAALPAGDGGVPWLLMMGGGTVLGYLLAVWWLQPISKDELARILGALKPGSSNR